MRLFTLFLLWPLAEIALFVTVGGAIGLLWTLVVIAGSAVLGVWLLRSRGVRSAAEMRRGLTVVRGGGLGKLAGDVMVMLAGVLLILPGFLTDMIGLVLLVPPIRAVIPQQPLCMWRVLATHSWRRWPVARVLALAKAA